MTDSHAYLDELRTIRDALVKQRRFAYGEVAGEKRSPASMDLLMALLDVQLSIAALDRALEEGQEASRRRNLQ